MQSKAIFPQVRFDSNCCNFSLATCREVVRDEYCYLGGYDQVRRYRFRESVKKNKTRKGK